MDLMQIVRESASNEKIDAEMLKQFTKIVKSNLGCVGVEFTAKNLFQLVYIGDGQEGVYKPLPLLELLKGMFGGIDIETALKVMQGETEGEEEKTEGGFLEFLKNCLVLSLTEKHKAYSMLFIIPRKQEGETQPREGEFWLMYAEPLGTKNDKLKGFSEFFDSIEMLEALEAQNKEGAE
jgi:hypothetical protein